MENSTKRIFLVDDNVTNLTIGKNVLSEHYNVITMPSGEKLLIMLEKTLPDLILLDIEMPNMNGYEAIKIIKKNKNTAHIPVIFLTAKIDTLSELEGLSLGAVDYIGKPFSPLLLLKRIELHLLVQDQKRQLQNYNNNLQQMIDKKTNSVIELKNSILRTMAELVECRDDITGGHIERTQLYLKILIDAILEKNLYQNEVSNWDIGFILSSSQLHDVGKIAIKDSILQKPGKLTFEEFELMKTHVNFGVNVINKIQQTTTEKEFLDHAKVFIATHHEKWNGTGYPEGLKGDDIPLQGRLMAIADVYDALTNERPYKKAFTHKEAANIINESNGTHFDPCLIDLFNEYAHKFEEVSENL